MPWCCMYVVLHDDPSAPPFIFFFPCQFQIFQSVVEQATQILTIQWKLHLLAAYVACILPYQEPMSSLTYPLKEIFFLHIPFLVSIHNGKKALTGSVRSPHTSATYTSIHSST